MRARPRAVGATHQAAGGDADHFSAGEGWGWGWSAGRPPVAPGPGCRGGLLRYS